MNCEKADRASSFPITRPLRQVLPSPEKKEGKGPLRADFDQIAADTKLGQASWEKAESMLQKTAFELALEKASLACGDLDILFAGDLLNQCISSSFAARDTNLPFLGLYGACSTMAESLLLAASFVNAGYAKELPR